MNFIGHTMGVPNLNIFGAIELFSSLGFNGIEVRCAKDGQIDTETADKDLLQLIKKQVDKYSLPVVCLTPYYKDFITEKRNSEINNLQKVIEIADELNCPLIRLYGGIYPPPENVSLDDAWEKTVTGIREVSALAEDKSIKFCIETHTGSLTFSASDTVKMVKDIDRDNVGILLDYAWVYIAGKETCEEAVKMCMPYLLHCHYKDCKLAVSGSSLKRVSCLMGEGDIPWKTFFKTLSEYGYQGTLSDEYEKYWQRDVLPNAPSGMKYNLNYVKNYLEELGIRN